MGSIYVPMTNKIQQPLEMELAANLGTRIKALRDEQRLSQRQLAEKALISKSMIAKYENGLHLAPVTVLVRLARVLGVTVDQLLGYAGQDQLVTCLRELETMDPESRALVTQLMVGIANTYRVLYNRCAGRAVRP
jgi:transcriptional regulator with XRE-family HTH domain